MLGGIGEAAGIFTILPGVVLMAITMIGWWRDVVKEATFQGHHTPVVQLGHRYGMMLFIGSEVMFFAAFFWAFFNASLFPVGGVWPPEGVTGFGPLPLPAINTLILVTSGWTVTKAHHKLLDGNQQGLVNWLIITIVLGILFTGLQAYEYWHAPFDFTDGIYSSTFFMATGFHGAHVIIGTTFLTVCLFRAMKGHFKPEHHFGFEAAAWYWHFVDVVWLFLFVSVYTWGYYWA
jgi:heme/copper-type cytochrome/quinol oxidase subunit 3